MQSLSEVFSDFANCGIGLYLLLPASHCLNFLPKRCELFPNGSLEGCVLNADMDAQLGGNIFPCQQGQWIYFNERDSLPAAYFLHQGLGSTTAFMLWFLAGVVLGWRSHWLISCCLRRRCSSIREVEYLGWLSDVAEEIN